MSTVTRRSVAKGAAWAVPAVTVGAPAAYAAASQTVSSAYACQLFEGTGGVNYQTFDVSFGFATEDGSTVKAGTKFTYHFVLDGSATGTAPGLPTTTTGGASVVISNASVSGAVRTFDVTLTLTADYASGTCSTVKLAWDESGTSSNFMTPNAVVTMTATGGTAPAGAGTVSNTSSLKFDVGQRYAVSNGSNPNKAFRFLSRTGAQGSYPSVQYSAMSNYQAAYGTNGSTCAATSGNNSSTLYPDGTCAKVNITSGQAAVPAHA